MAEARQPAWEPSFGRSSARTSGPGRRSSSTRRDQASLHAAALVVVAGRDREGRTGTTPALLVEACPKPALLALTAAPPHALAPPRVAISLRFSLSLSALHPQLPTRRDASGPPWSLSLKKRILLPSYLKSLRILAWGSLVSEQHRSTACAGPPTRTRGREVRDLEGGSMTTTTTTTTRV